MTPATTPTTPPPVPKPRRRKPGRRVLIRNVDWDQYEKLLEAFSGRRNARLTYDRGVLEIMAPSNEHETDAAFLAHLAEVLTEERGLPVRRGGSFTMKRKDLKRGIEPDRCFWVTNADQVAGVRKIDLAVHHPPDLAIEVDVTNSSVDKLGIYAKLGVAELWRLDGDVLRFYQLGPKRKYAEVPTSPTFAGVTPADLVAFVIRARTAADQNPVTRDFRAWVRQRAAAQSPPPAPPTT